MRTFFHELAQNGNAPVECYASVGDAHMVDHRGKMQIFHVASQPSRHFVHVGRSKLW